MWGILGFDYLVCGMLFGLSNGEWLVLFIFILVLSVLGDMNGFKLLFFLEVYEFDEGIWFFIDGWWYFVYCDVLVVVGWYGLMIEFCVEWEYELDLFVIDGLGLEECVGMYGLFVVVVVGEGCFGIVGGGCERLWDGIGGGFIEDWLVIFWYLLFFGEMIGFLYFVCV